MLILLHLWLRKSTISFLVISLKKKEILSQQWYHLNKKRQAHDNVLNVLSMDFTAYTCHVIKFNCFYVCLKDNTSCLENVSLLNNTVFYCFTHLYQSSKLSYLGNIVLTNWSDAKLALIFYCNAERERE